MKTTSNSWINRIALSIVTAVFALTIGGCSSGDGVDTAKLEKSFAGSSDEMKANVQQVVAAVKSKDYSKAGAALTTLAQDAKLDETQKAAVQDVLKQVQTALQNMAKDAAKGVDDAAGKLKDALPK